MSAAHVDLEWLRSVKDDEIEKHLTINGRGSQQPTADPLALLIARTRTN
jgi:hypothetical protein